MTYHIKKIKDKIIKQNDNYASNIWDEIHELNVNSRLWVSNEYFPKTSVKLYYTDNGISVLFKTIEGEVRTVYHKINDPVYKDSCVEFFLNPDPANDDRYINFEINSAGVYLIGIGNSRNNRTMINPDKPEIFNIKTEMTESSELSGYKYIWTVEYFIPFEYLMKYYKSINISPGHEMLGNFYKCGDDMTYPHYLSWNPIESESPDFHNPKYFGRLVMSQNNNFV